jgi:pSer/pThr/pTyr-binding forkhead associated (FHA) protein
LETERKGPVIEVPSLIVKGGPTDGTIISLVEGTAILVGSGRLATLQLVGEEIGAAHIRITWDDAGISITDNGSMGGTYVNGEVVVTGPLADGDRIAFAPSGKKPDLPKLLVRIPPGTVLVTAPPPSSEPLTAPPPEEPARPTYAPVPKPPSPQARRPVKKPPPPWQAAVDALGRIDLDIDWRSPKILGPVAVVVLLVVGLGAYRLIRGPAPLVTALQPANGEPGNAIAVVGANFKEDTAKNTVRFGEVVATVVAGNATTLTVTVPEVADVASGQPVAVSVETRGGRTKPLSFILTRTPKVAALDPEAAMPGGTVTLRGQSLGGAVSVTVGGAAARVLEAKGDTIKFQVPNLPPTPPRTEPVLVRIGDRSSQGVDLLIGRLPVILETSPSRGDSGDRVILRGRGFGPDAAANKVTFAGVPALVLSASAREVVAAVPALLPGTSEAEIVVEAAGKPTTSRVVFAYTRPSIAVFRPRFVAADAGTSRSQAMVTSELGPLLLLSSKDAAASVQERALAVAAALNAAFDASASAFEAKSAPATGVSVGGKPDLLVQATAEDAAGYEAPPGLSIRNTGVTPAALAAHWAALLTDYGSLFVLNQRPVRMLGLSPRGKAFVDLQAELGFRPGGTVTPGRAGALSPALLGRMREMAFGLGKDATPTVGAALEGTWEGQLDDADGTTKPLTVRLRRGAAGKLAGSVATGGRVTMEQPFQSVTVAGDTVTMTVRSGASIRVLVGKLDSAGVTGVVHSGSPTGPQVGTFSLKFAP